MADIENVKQGLKYTIEMTLFNPVTGDTRDPAALNADDRITYDACIGAIDLLKSQQSEIKRLKVQPNVIRCKDCIYYLRPEYGYTIGACVRHSTWFQVRKYDFCSLAVKKEGDKHE